jgi:hypothetical protein
MQSSNLRLALVPSLFILGFLAAAEARAADNPIVGEWKWGDAGNVLLESNRTIHIKGKKVGVWEVGSFEHKNKRYEYKLIWDEGFDGRPHVCYVNLVNENRRLEGVDTEGNGISVHRK